MVFLFFSIKKIWDLIKKDILQIFTDFYNHTIDIIKLNRALIWLIYKVMDTITIKNFCTISLFNYNFKIFTKVLTSRFHQVLDTLIGLNQHTFLKGRNIMNNVITAN
jgi:hypothetical protein